MRARWLVRGSLRAALVALFTCQTALLNAPPRAAAAKLPHRRAAWQAAHRAATARWPARRMPARAAGAAASDRRAPRCRRGAQRTRSGPSTEPASARSCAPDSPAARGLRPRPRYLRGAREHFLHDVPQPGPTLRRDARAASIGIAAADALALAICVAAPAPQAQPFVGFAQNCRKLFRQLVLLARSSRHCTHFTGPR